MSRDPDRIVAVEAIGLLVTLGLVSRTDSVGLWLAWATAAVVIAGATLVWLNR